MNVEPTRQFLRDVRRLGSVQVRRRLDRVIEELIEATSITEVSGVRRIRAEGQHYRIRIGDYRLGTTMDGETVVLRRFLPGEKSTDTFRDGVEREAVYNRVTELVEMHR